MNNMSAASIDQKWNTTITVASSCPGRRPVTVRVRSVPSPPLTIHPARIRDVLDIVQATNYDLHRGCWTLDLDSRELSFDLNLPVTGVQPGDVKHLLSAAVVTNMSSLAGTMRFFTQAKVSERGASVLRQSRHHAHAVKASEAPRRCSPAVTCDVCHGGKGVCEYTCCLSCNWDMCVSCFRAEFGSSGSSHGSVHSAGSSVTGPGSIPDRISGGHGGDGSGHGGGAAAAGGAPALPSGLDAFLKLLMMEAAKTTIRSLPGPRGGGPATPSDAGGGGAGGARYVRILLFQMCTTLAIAMCLRL